MKRKDTGLSHHNFPNQSDKNISRLVKLADDSGKPGRAFTESLMDSALRELKQLEVEKKNKKQIFTRFNWPEKAMGWAAMVAAACGAGLTVVVSTLLKMNFVLEAIVVLTMFFNWLTYLGGRIL
jgi:hypothetical protein